MLSIFYRRKHTISKSIKTLSWDQYIGETVGKCYCIVCNKRTITQHTFDAGHIISRYNKGKDTVDNIVPICPSCNKSMGTQNMSDYIKRHHPEQLKSFKNKSYNFILYKYK